MRISCLLFFLTWVVSSGCAPSKPRLTFPNAPISQTLHEIQYDTNGNGQVDWTLEFDGQHRVNRLVYHDTDTRPDRVYRLADYSSDSVPHLIVLLDSIPFDVMKERYAAGDFRWFDPPVKVIPPFPSLTELCYTRVLHAPPLAGMGGQYYDARAKGIHNGFLDRATGEREPWERRLAYNAHYLEASFTYLDPREWLPVEMGRIREALNASPDRVTIVYAVTASGMACKYGKPGMDATLDAAKQLCLQLLYERHGAIKITLMADHGHNLTESHSASPAVAAALSNLGFHISNSLRQPNDVVIELAALVNYVGLRTTQPASVADAVTRAKEVELAAYLQGNSVIVRNAKGTAAIDFRNNAFRYRIIDADVLYYEPVIKSLRTSGKLSADGFAADRDWLTATVDQQYPDAPHRLWDAFHNLVVNPPDVMVTLRDGFDAGVPWLGPFITMKSTHGSLDQKNSATFLMTMTGRTREGQVLRSEDVLSIVEPGFEPRVGK